MDELCQRLPEILQNTYFNLNPFNPNNTEDNYQELLRENLEKIVNVRVHSETSVQKKTHNIFYEEVKLKNKSERHDLTIDDLQVLLELKNLACTDDYCVHQLLHYLDMTSYQYGILVNFAKPNRKNDYRVSYTIYKKGELQVHTDKYGYTYKRYSYTLLDQNSSENYYDMVCVTNIDSVEHTGDVS